LDVTKRGYTINKNKYFFIVVFFDSLKLTILLQV
jgi:hypothetical protein